jgi:hypothetical protein
MTTRTKAVIVALLTTLTLATGAQATSVRWTKISTDKADVVANHADAASIYKAHLLRVKALKLNYFATGRAHITGTVYCSQGFDSHTYDFDFHGKNGSRTLNAKGNCTILATISMPHDGTVEITLFKR